jgi:hypothetical protein
MHPTRSCASSAAPTVLPAAPVLAVLTALTALGIWTGCASTPTAAQLDARLREVGASVEGLSHPRVFAVHAGSRMEALTLLADARNQPRERLSLDLAQQIGLARTRRLHLVVGGPWARLNEQLLTNALSYREDALPGLVLVVVSPEAPGPALDALAKRRRVRLIHRPLTTT